MSKKAVVTWHVAPFQHVVAEDITDPAEIAAIDAMRLRLRRKKSGPKAKDKPVVTWHVAPFQHVVAEDITDPAEIAAIDAMRLRLQRKKSRPKAKAKGKDAKPVAKSAAK